MACQATLHACVPGVGWRRRVPLRRAWACHLQGGLLVLTPGSYSPPQTKNTRALNSANFPPLPTPPPPCRCNHPENGFTKVSQWRPGSESNPNRQEGVAEAHKLQARGVEQKWVF